jgi:hypothetical protein
VTFRGRAEIRRPVVADMDIGPAGKRFACPFNDFVETKIGIRAYIIDLVAGDDRHLIAGVNQLQA